MTSDAPLLLKPTGFAGRNAYAQLQTSSANQYDVVWRLSSGRLMRPQPTFSFVSSLIFLKIVATSRTATSP